MSWSRNCWSWPLRWWGVRRFLKLIAWDWSDPRYPRMRRCPGYIVDWNFVPSVFLFFTPPRNHSVIGDWHIFGATYYGCLRLGDGIISRVTRKSLRNQCLAWLVRCCEPAKHHWYFWRSWLRRLKRPIRVVWGCLVPAETVTLESCNMLYYKCPIKHPEIMVQERAAHTRPGKRWQKAIEAMAQSK